MIQLFLFKKKNIILFLLLVLFGFSLFCQDHGANTLRTGVLSNFPPQYSVNSKNEPQGFAIDIIERLADLTGFTLQYVVKDTWDELFVALESGEIDIIPNQGITQRRMEGFSFSSPVETFPVHIFTRSDSGHELAGLNDLSGKSVAVVKTNIGEVLVGDIENIDVQTFLSAENALFSLISGNTDALIFPKPVLLSMARICKVDNQIKTNGLPLTEIKRSISVNKGNEWILERFNSVIPSFIGSRDYRQIYTKWYGKPTPFWTISRIVLVMSVIVILIIIIMLVWKYKSTEILVRKRTRELYIKAQLLEQVLEGVFTIDVNRKITSWNKGAESLFGYKNEEILGKYIEFLWCEHCAQINKPIFTDPCEIKYLKCDFKYKKNNGTIFDGLTSITEFQNENKEMIGYIIIIQDISDRMKTLEEISDLKKRNQALLDHSPTCHKIIDSEFNLQYMNATGYEMLKIQDDSEIYGTPYPFNFFPEDQRKEMISAMKIAFSTGDIITLKAKGCDAYGKELWFHHTIQPVLADDRNRVVEYLTIVSDNITDQKLMEEKLRHSEKMDAIGHIAGGVAHDFNNQLSGILGYADLLRAKLKDPDDIRYVNAICTAADRSADLTKKLLAFSRKGQYRNERVDLNQIILETIDMLSHSIDKRINIQFNKNAEHTVVSGDESQLQNAILNLAINSSEAMTEGGSIDVTTENVDITESHHLSSSLSNGRYIKLRIKDTGSGIPLDIQSRIFEPFYTTKKKGTGMGLAAVYGTIEQHNGTTICESVPGEGTSFELYLPVVQIQQKREHIQSPIIRNNKALQILVVEDEEMVRDFVCHILEGENHAVMSCKNGKEGIGVYEERWKEIDLVIIDMIMPEMNGPETFRAMKVVNPNIKAIIATGYSMNEQVQELLNEGVLEIIQKPFRVEELNTVINNVMP